MKKLSLILLIFTFFLSGIGGVSYANVIKSNNFGKINGRNYVGGVVGKFDWASLIITDCLNYGKVEGGSHIGGVVGYLKNGVLQYCKNVADVEVRSIRFGGVVGWVENSSKVYNSLSVSKVKGVEANEIYYTNLKLFYIDPKNGEVGLKKHNATAMFLVDATEEILLNKGFKIFK